MASLGDLRKAVHKVGAWGLLRRVIKQIGEDNVAGLAAAMSYSWLLAIFPFVLFIIAVLPYVPALKTEQVAEVADKVLETLPAQARTLVESVSGDVMNQSHGGLLSVGIIMALWVASGGMTMTIAALSRAYDAPDRPLYKARPLAVLMTIIIVGLILSAIVLLPVLSIVKAWLVRQPDILYAVQGALWLIDIGRWLLALSAILMALAILYYMGPNIKQRFHFITPGSLFVVVLWIALGLGFRFYVDNFGNYNKTYGTLGGVIILLVLFYLNSMVLLIGAEINSEVDMALQSADAIKRGDYTAETTDAPDSPDAPDTPNTTVT